MACVRGHSYCTADTTGSSTSQRCQGRDLVWRFFLASVDTFSAAGYGRGVLAGRTSNNDAGIWKAFFFLFVFPCPRCSRASQSPPSFIARAGCFMIIHSIFKHRWVLDKKKIGKDVNCCVFNFLSKLIFASRVWYSLIWDQSGLHKFGRCAWPRDGLTPVTPLDDSTRVSQQLLCPRVHQVLNNRCLTVEIY